jgi:signal transduction histidine kinase/DNA-binding response OmpR family regulator
MPTAEQTRQRAMERERVRRLMRGAGVVGSIAIVALITAGMSITYRYWDQAERRQRLVVHSYEVLDAGRQLMSTLQDAETGQRGFLLTGRPDYLTPYDQARLKLESVLSQLEALATRPAQAQRTSALRQAATAKMQELDNTLLLYRQGGRDRATAMVDGDLGQRTMTAVRVEMAAFIADEQAALGRWHDAQRDDQRRATWLAAATLGGSLVALLAALWLSLRGVRRLSAIERQLAARSQLLQSTLENLQDAIVVLDAAGAVVAWNQAFARLIGWTTSDRAFLTRADLLSEKYPAARALLGRILSRDQATLALGTTDQRVVHEGRDYEIGLGRMPAGELVITFLDVTDKIRSDEVLRHAQKMEAIGQLTGGMAHDFNNILQVIQTNLDLLAADVGGNPESAQRVETAQLGAQRAARLTRQLLAFARRQSLEPVATNVGRLVLDMADLLHHSLGEKVELACTVASGAWNARVDPGQLENAIINLAVNARDAMPDGGTLTVEVSNVLLRRDHADLADGAAPGEYVLVAVADTGTGMPSDVVDKAFDPFFTTKEEGKGTGLGLSMVYGFIAQSGGVVKIDSAPGRGTTVRMYLPRTRDAVVEQPAAHPTTLEGSERILLVEDNENVRRSLVEMLSGLKYRVTDVANPDAAMAELQAGRSFDLLLSDIVMPGKVTAVELAAAARRYQPQLAVLFMSGYAQSPAIRSDLPRGVALMNKPFRRDELATRIRAALTAAAAGTASPAEPAAATSASPPAPRPSAGGDSEHDQLKRGCHVLLVEDEVLVRMSTADSLKRLGCTVETAGTAERALDLLHGPDAFHLMITDIRLPGMGGVELAAEARRLKPALMIAVASGYRDSALQASLPPNTTYLVKPYTGTDLHSLLERAGALTRNSAAE